MYARSPKFGLRAYFQLEPNGLETIQRWLAIGLATKSVLSPIVSASTFQGGNGSGLIKSIKNPLLLVLYFVVCRLAIQP